jgi:hypothetical protein
MSNTIYDIRYKELSAKEAALLWRFTAAYRPHDPAPTWQELKAQGLEKVDEDSLMDIIIDQHEHDKEHYEP